MKILKLFLLTAAAIISFSFAQAQNALINVLSQNSGIIKNGGTSFAEITINNTDPGVYIDIYKLKVQVSVPSNIVSISNTGHVLPTGWTIISNDGFTINLSNGKDMIAATDARTILIALKANKLGGPSTISGQLSFSDGISPGANPGFLKADNPADNFSTSTFKVVR